MGKKIFPGIFLLLLLGMSCAATGSGVSDGNTLFIPGIFAPEEPSVTYIPLIKTNWTSSAFGVETKSIDQVSMTRAHEANNAWLRYNGLLWSDYQPQNASQFIRDTNLEADLILANQNNQQVVLVIRKTPTWARVYPESICGPMQTAKIQDFANFMSKVVEIYSAPPYNVLYYEIWNEQDAPIDLSTNSKTPWGCWGDPAKPYFGGGDYADVLKAVYPAVKNANPKAQVVIGGLLLDCDPRINTNCAMSQYFEGILVNEGGSFFDVVNFHSYNYFSKYSPIYKEKDIDGWREAGGQIEGKLDYLREIMNKYSITSKTIMLSETALIIGTTTPTGIQLEQYEQDKAEYLVWLHTRNWAEGISITTWYHIDEGGWRGSGLLDVNNQPLPAYFAYQTMTDTLYGAEYANNDPATDPDLKIFEFNKGYRVWVLFSLDGEQKTIDLSNFQLPGTINKAFDLYGNPVNISGDIVIFDQPMYIVFNQ